MPAARHFSRSSLMTFAVSAMMGSRLAPRLASSSRMRRVAVNPSITGIWQSINTASKSVAAMRSRASAPLLAMVTSAGEILQRALRHALIDRIVLDQEDLVAAEGRQGLRRGFDARCVRRLAGQDLIHEIGQQRGANGLQTDGIRAVFAIGGVMLGAEQGHQNEGQAGMARIGAQRLQEIQAAAHRHQFIGQHQIEAAPAPIAPGLHPRRRRRRCRSW